MFYIWNVATMKAVLDIFKMFHSFPTVEAAEQNIAYLIEPSSGNEYVLPFSRADFEIRPLETAEWAQEARMSLANGDMERPVWFNKPWYQDRMEQLKTYAHVDPAHPEHISYFASEKHGSVGRITRTTPGRFLKKYFGDILSNDTIEALASEHRDQWGEAPVLKWAYTADEIEAVYSMDASFYSCMQHTMDEEQWPTDVHPVRAYGDADLHLAYLVSGDRLFARALVWKEKGLVGRVYGDGALLRNALRKVGINTESDAHDYDTFEGARITKIPLKREIESIPAGCEAIVVPYIDGSADGLDPDPDDPTMLIITNQYWHYETADNPAKFTASSDRGYGHEWCECAHCNERGTYFLAVVSKNGVIAHFCEECVHSDDPQIAFMDDYSNKWYDGRFHKPIEVWHDGIWGVGASVGVYGVTPTIVCAKSGRHYQPNSVALMADGTHWGKDYFATYGYTNADGKNYAIDGSMGEINVAANDLFGGYALAS